MLGPIAVRLLGTLQVSSPSGAALTVPGRRAAALLACLAEPDLGWTRERIVALLWHDRDPEHARASLRQELLRLRRALDLPASEPLDLDGALRFSPDHVGFDVAAFRAAARAGNRDAEALSLYRGDLLQGVRPDATPFGQWLTAQRRALADLALDCNLRLLRDAEQRGDATATEGLVLRLLAIDPAHEEAHRRLIRRHAEHRDLGRALAQFWACADALRERQGRVPSAETEALIERVKAQLGGQGNLLPSGAAGKPSIAVLPFVDQTPAADQDYFAAGVADEVIRLLSRMRWLFVIAFNASLAYRGKEIDAKQVGRELGVRYLLQGRIRRTAERLRIGCQLVETATGTTLWVNRYDGVASDIFALEDKVATSVAAAIEPRIEGAEIHRAAARPTADLTAYDLYLRALPHIYSWERERVLIAMGLLRLAQQRDPHFALALGYEAWCHGQLANNGWTEYAGPGGEVALGLADRAILADPDDPVVVGCVALVRGFFGRDIDACLGLIDNALDVNPSFAAGWQWSGFLRLFAGQSDIAVDHFRQSLRLSPGRDRWNGACEVGIAIARFFRGEFAEAAALLERAVDEVPTLASGHRFLAASYARLGDRDAARRAVERLCRLTPQPKAHGFVFRDLAQRSLYADGLALALAASDVAEPSASTDGL